VTALDSTTITGWRLKAPTGQTTIYRPTLSDRIIANPGWIQTNSGGTDPKLKYTRTYTPPLNKIELEFCWAGDDVRSQKLTLDDFVTSFAFNSFWGTPGSLTRVINLTIAGNSESMYIVVVLEGGNQISLHCMDSTTGENTGKIRRVKVNDIPQDWLVVKPLA
jgi:hypothetical protein